MAPEPAGDRRRGSPAFSAATSTGAAAVATPSFVRRAHRAGLHVHVWTGDEASHWVSIDDAASMDTLLDMGVDGLITDRTDVLKQVLTRRGQWRDSP